MSKDGQHYSVMPGVVICFRKVRASSAHSHGPVDSSFSVITTSSLILEIQTPHGTPFDAPVNVLKRPKGT